MNKKKWFAGLLMLGCLSLLFASKTIQSNALEEGIESKPSESMVASYESASIKAQEFKVSKIVDGDTATYSKTSKETSVTVAREDGIGFLYLIFDRVPQPWTVTEDSSGWTKACGTYGFLHEYVEVEGAPKELILTFPEGTVIADIYVFSQGKIPDWVQTWEPPCEKADLLLVSSHSDDEQLFFAGVLPYYAGELGYEVQVAYVVQHFAVGKSQNHVRPHEQLNGLWTVGVRHYPVMSEFPDLYAESKDREIAFNQALDVFGKYGYTYDDFVAYMVENFRRFKPLVVVSHDLNGEYGHGTHVLCSSAITDAIEVAKEENAFPDSAEKYGTWGVEKVYLHLYQENQIVMDWDVPLEQFEEKSAFEVTRDGFDCHKSQHWTWFYKWIYGKEGKPIHKASDIKKYSPCKYGLYYTSVGLDEVGGDFFEHVDTYEERTEILIQTRAKMQRISHERLIEAIKVLGDKRG